MAMVPRRREVPETSAWLLFIFFLPFLGLTLFLLIGSSRYPGWRRERFRHVQAQQARTVDALRRKQPDIEGGQPIAQLAEALGGLPACAGNSVELMDDYDGVVERLVADIDLAVRSVHILVYIFADDAIGLRVADALSRAVERGVEARVMFDPVGSSRWRRGTSAMLKQRRIQVCEALPFGGFRHRTRRDMRNHRKLFVIDDRVGYAGSQNLVAKDFRPGVINRELVVRVTGPIVASLAMVVRSDWSIETGFGLEDPSAICAPTGAALLQLLPSGPNYPLAGFENILVWQLHQARHRVVIVTPYFIPEPSLVEAMRTAVARGVSVDLVVSGVVDQRLVNLAQCSYYEAVLIAGVHLRLFKGYLLHAKNVSIDGRLAIVGSSNVDVRSFRLNEEASLLIYDSDTISRVELVQAGYVDRSDTMDLARWTKRAGWRRTAENVARLLSPLL